MGPRASITAVRDINNINFICASVKTLAVSIFKKILKKCLPSELVLDAVSLLLQTGKRELLLTTGKSGFIALVETMF